MKKKIIISLFCGIIIDRYFYLAKYSNFITTHLFKLMIIAIPIITLYYYKLFYIISLKLS